jgi:hypothetical protein
VNVILPILNISSSPTDSQRTRALQGNAAFSINRKLKKCSLHWATEKNGKYF